MLRERSPYPGATGSALLLEHDGFEPAATGYLDYISTAKHAGEFDAMRRLNAAIPLMAGLALPATPFLITGTTDDRLRAQDCLAAAAYYEAGDDAIGQRAVVQVALNRVRHPAFPSSICGVVFEGAQRQTGCQFTFTCDGSLDRYHPSDQAWQRARQVAAEALYGYTASAVGQATHYHTDWVHPPWSDRLDKIARIGTHLFFQARGVRPRDFSSAYAGVEPRIARLEFLSPAHAAPSPAPSDAAVAQTSLALPLGPSADRPMKADAAGERLPKTTTPPEFGLFLVALDPAANPDSYLQLAQARCAGHLRCRFIGWTDPNAKVDRVPIPGSAIDAMSFSFDRDDTGAMAARWNCREFPRRNSRECLRRAL
ncbi:MAG: cell wall hydrolase [Sphingomonas sp.]|uniref:cell wall hydrolase n=1 Tax=Sphingomonas sp. TaxID=28214 RepID=UPI001B07D6DF|nr:cell wall hydrolase [Sphingomonas sp.]MBO9623908.1 cell wall hydrolase [Sphingomonas sp.]